MPMLEPLDEAAAPPGAEPLDEAAAPPAAPPAASGPCYVAAVNGAVIAKSCGVKFANNRAYFPMDSLRLDCFVESSKLWR